jgi:hypothetical protein
MKSRNDSPARGSVQRKSSSSSLIQMKAVILTALVLGLLGFVAAQTAVIQTFYSDSTCATQAGPYIDVLGQNYSNPHVMPLNQCVKYLIMYMKFASCGGGTLASGKVYMDQSCTQEQSPISFPLGKCEPTENVPGTQSTKITSNCSSAQPQPTTSAAATPASATLAFISVVFSVIALLL